MEYKTVITLKEDYIGTIILNRPEKLNTFTDQLANDLNDALFEMDKDDDVRVIIIKGAGRGFCAGVDLNGFEGKSPVEFYKWIELMGKMNITISTMVKPVIASVHNIATANGIGIVAAADLVVATKDTKFGATAVKVGLFCMGPAVALSRCIGRKRALELLLTGDLIDAEEAERIGLINRVVENDKLEEETLKLAKKIAKHSPIAVQMGKKSFYDMADLEFKKALELTNNNFALLCTTEDAKEGIDAFLNKRPPNWKLK